MPLGSFLITWRRFEKGLLDPHRLDVDKLPDAII